MSDNRFKTAFMAMTPDANPVLHRANVETSIYRLTTVLVRNEAEAVKVCRGLVKDDGVQSIILCPGFTNRGVALVTDAVGDGVSINVARGDGPSNAIAHERMKEAGFFGKS